MSAAEIADNKWELTASKPPVATAGGVAQLLVMGFFAAFFLWMIINSFIGAVGPKADSDLVKAYEQAGVGGTKADAPAAPAE